MKNFLPFLLALIISISAISCSNSKTNKKINLQNTIPQKVEPVIIGRVTSSRSISYYLPSNYSDSVKYPLIYIFSAHGNGNLPLNRFYKLAEKYGFILVASNVSKNGLPSNILEPALQQFYTDAIKKFSVDQKRLYTMGFSGGARVASMMAIQNTDIRGAILCGGGLANPSLPEGRKLDFLLFAGNDDFNCIELMHLDTMLGKTFRHYFLKFTGKHQWPAALDMEDGFYWTLFNEMRDDIIPKNDTLIRTFLNTNTQTLKNTKAILDKYRILLKITVFLDNLTNIDIYQNQLQNIKNSSNFQKKSKEIKMLFIKEQKQEQELIKNMSSQSIEWWQKKTNEMAADTTKETLMAHSHKRILNYLSLAAYLQCSRAIQSNQNQQTYKFIKLYQTIDPNNTEGFYLEAIFSIQQGNQQAAITALKNAILLGFNDMDRINVEPEFQTLFNVPEFQNVIELMEQ